MDNLIPQYLHRGDSDSKNIRHLRDTINGYQLLTNLINGGNGREISEKPLIDLIDKHVGAGWKTTHFLSFSDCEDISFRFGLNCEIDEVSEKRLLYNDFSNSNSDWDFAIITIDTRAIDWSVIDTGVYKGIYSSSLKVNPDKCEIILMDIRTILKNYIGYETSKSNADRDKEWLILPLNPIASNRGAEYSAIFEISHIVSEIQKFKKNHYQTIFI